MVKVQTKQKIYIYIYIYISRQDIQDSIRNLKPN